jgi:periplasmic protein TonB
MYTRNQTKAGVCSITLHAVAVTLLLFASSLKPVRTLPSQVTHLFAPVELKPFKQQKRSEGGGGGGGGPRRASRQFAPPKVEFLQASLITPTIDADVPDFGPPSVGRLVGISIGGTGIGNQRGPGLGDGPPGPGGPGNGGFKSGNGVSAPMLVFSPEPEYSEEARKAKFQGTVRLALVVDEHGSPAQIRIITPLGLGLDEKAIEAVQKWKFKPGMKDGKPVAVQASVEVNFRLL